MPACRRDRVSVRRCARVAIVAPELRLHCTRIMPAHRQARAPRSCVRSRTAKLRLRSLERGVYRLAYPHVLASAHEFGHLA